MKIELVTKERYDELLGMKGDYVKMKVFPDFIKGPEEVVKSWQYYAMGNRVFGYLSEFNTLCIPAKYDIEDTLELLRSSNIDLEAWIVESCKEDDLDFNPDQVSCYFHERGSSGVPDRKISTGYYKITNTITKEVIYASIESDYGDNIIKYKLKKNLDTSESDIYLMDNLISLLLYEKGYKNKRLSEEG